MKILITGGAGFIGSAVVRHLINHTSHEVINVDKLTYAGNLESLKDVERSERYSFENVDICDYRLIERIFRDIKPDKVMHLAAESHVDRSIDAPSNFIKTNVEGTMVLLEVARKFWSFLENDKKADFRFHHISTDEVYGDLKDTGGLFTESTSYAPSSPYSASKAASDHLVRAWGRTYDLPILITNCSNNYGPYQFPEKLIPLTIINALQGKPISIYGKGTQIRDWLYVEDHAKALVKVLMEGLIGETYNIGGCNEKKNIEVVLTLCNILDDLISDHPPGISNYRDLIKYVDDRPGHDHRYAIDSSKIQKNLGWLPEEDFDSGMLKTVKWYLSNQEWWNNVIDGSYKGERLGIGKYD